MNDFGISGSPRKIQWEETQVYKDNTKAKPKKDQELARQYRLKHQVKRLRKQRTRDSSDDSIDRAGEDVEIADTPEIDLE